MAPRPLRLLGVTGNWDWPEGGGLGSHEPEVAQTTEPQALDTKHPLDQDARAVPGVLRRQPPWQPACPHCPAGDADPQRSPEVQKALLMWIPTWTPTITMTALSAATMAVSRWADQSHPPPRTEGGARDSSGAKPHIGPP